MQVVNDHDHIGSLDAQPRIAVFEIALFRDDLKVAPPCFSANGGDRLAVSIDRANGQPALGQPQRMSTAPTRHIESSPR